jgi:uncharacterized protein (TIGR03083 family)
VDAARLLGSLDVDVDRVRQIAAMNLDAPVPTCPGWTVEDLVRHLANGYLNVVVRRLRAPQEVPKQDLAAERPLAALDRAYAVMTDEFGACRNNRSGSTESLRFWIRRITHETAVHRIDAELAVAVPVTPIPPDLAVDGIGELLTAYLAQETQRWQEDYQADLSDWTGRWVLVTAASARWRVTVRPNGVHVTPVDSVAAPTHAADAVVAGEPVTLMRWMYNRGDAGEIAFGGDRALIAQLRRLLTAITSIG